MKLILIKVQKGSKDEISVNKDELKTKFYNLLEDPQRRIPKEDQTVFSKRIAEWQTNKGNLEFLKESTQLRQWKYITLLRKLIYRLKAGTLRAKQLKKLK